MKRFVLSREQLYERIWSKPLRDNAKELGLSDVGLGKLCRRAGIPTPPQGYWLMSPGPERDRLRVLPQKPGPGDRHAFEFRVEDEDAVTRAESARERVRDAMRSAAPSTHDFDVAARLIKGIRKGVSSRTRDERGILRPDAKLPIPVRVSPAELDRALLAMERLLVRLSSLRVPLEQHLDHAGLVSFEVEGQKYSAWVEEHATRSERPLTAKELKEKAADEARGWKYYQRDRWINTPSGKLVLKLGHDRHDSPRRQWGDLVEHGIEHRVDEFIAEVFAFATLEHAEVVRRNRAARQRRAVWLRELRLKQREEHARLKVRELLRQAQGWGRAQVLRGYIDAVRRADLASLQAFGSVYKRENWLAWARKCVDVIDPIASGRAGKAPAPPPLRSRD